MSTARMVAKGRPAVLAAMVALLGPVAAMAQEPPRKVRLTVMSSAGEAQVPSADRPTVLLFARVEQPQSATAVENLKLSLKELGATQVLVVLSGKDPGEAAKAFTALLPWPVVTDADYTLVGQLEVRVWPTTIVVNSVGEELSRLTGLPQTYVRDLSAYLAFAAGKIDRPALEQRLSAVAVVSDGAGQIAGRHLQMALRALEKRLIDQARGEVEEGLKHQPRDARLRLTLARIDLLQGQPRTALNTVEQLDDKSVPSSEIETVRGAALVQLNRPDEAIAALQSAIKLNPNPGEAYYHLGEAFQHKGMLAEAVGAFRSAYQSTHEGRLHAPLRAQGGPTTQP